MALEKYSLNKLAWSIVLFRFPDSISTRTLFRHLIYGEITELIPPDSISTRTLFRRTLFRHGFYFDCKAKHNIIT